jgi:hypothetical protein
MRKLRIIKRVLPHSQFVRYELQKFSWRLTLKGMVWDWRKTESYEKNGFGGGWTYSGYFLERFEALLFMDTALTEKNLKIEMIENE